MEFDSQSQYSDVGEDYSASENGEIFSSDYAILEENQPSFLEAKTIYLLMQNNVPVSRATRLQWLLDHLNTIVTPSQKLTESCNNLEVISAIPREQNLTQCNRFLITYRTELKFLAHKYRFVYCLDMSPSNATVDIQKGEILFDEILNCFRASLEGLCREFMVPENSIIFQPCIFLTVIVNTPFFMSPAQQVLVKGVQITQDNITDIIHYVENQFHLLEGKIADVSAASLDQLNIQRAQSEGLVGDLFDLPESSKIYSRVPMVTPDVNFVNMLRYSMLAISLLPEYCMSHILVVTDGIAAMPDSNIMESLIYQLHYDSIAVSFLKVGSSFHPHAGAGFVSYTDLLYFLAHSTLGTCLENFVHLKNETSLALNMYHELFLLWSFHSANKYACSKYCDNSRWTSSNDMFYSHKVPALLSKRQTDDTTTASISLLLARRLREGFTVDSIFYLNGNLEIKLILQWKSSIYLHYKVKSQWPATKHLTHFEVYTSAPYEFLHDLTCALKKESKSLYRQCIMDRFRMRLAQLQSADHRLDQHLSACQNTKDWYTLPDSVKSGIPVFILNNLNPLECSKLILTPSVSCVKFVNIWQPICQIETNHWRKWFHTQKLSLILRHDNPLPKYLHLANSSQRFQVVQCRQAATVLYGKLAEWASFVLIDNHTYLKLLYQESEKPPLWFCIVRVSSKFPCAVVNIGFSTGTPGIIRRDVVNELKNDISALFYSPSPFKIKENSCCMLMQKPLEKILIRYERIPRSYSTVIFPDGTQPPHSPLNLPSPFAGSLFTTLSRYLFHKRWIWSANLAANPKLPDQSLARILNTLTRMRIREGFNFAHSASGIITMAIELWMEPPATCTAQYVLFPPHCAWVSDDIFSDSDDDYEQSSDSEIELQMVTEVWIEPQYGRVVPSNSVIGYIDNKYYYDIANAIKEVDMHCIGALLTLEHLSLMCQDTSVNNVGGSFSHLNQTNVNSSRKNVSRRSSRNSYFDSPCVPQKGINGINGYPIICPRIEHIPFNFDPVGILSLCQQTELLFSMFIEAKEKNMLVDPSVDKANRLLLDNFLEHLGILHDRELELTKDDSDRFSQEILLRHRNKHPHVCPITESLSYKGYQKESGKKTVSQWRCFIKGVSVTHVILTFVASTLDDLKTLLSPSSTNIPSFNESLSDQERSPSRDSNYSDVPINTTNSICLPVYVFDCPLSRLVNSFVNNSEEASPINGDIYEDHRFKNNSFIREEYIKLKSEDNTETADMKDDIETDLFSVKQHCKTLVLTHSKCFTISLFTALHMGVYIHNADVQSAMEECEESVTEIDITEYLTTICGHIKQSKSDEISLIDLQKPHPCSDLKQLHKLIKDKFFKTICLVFDPIPTNREYYFHRNLRTLEVVEDPVIDSDDEVSENLSEIIEFRVDRELSSCSEGTHLLQRMESAMSDMLANSNSNPLFLHLICTLRYDNGHVLNTSLHVIPTCLGELIQNIETTLKCLDKSKLQITLDMLCLTLPADVECIINDYSTQGLRSTSFCSDGFQPSIGSTISDASYNSQVSEPLKHLSETQKKAIFSIQKEIKWLLQDEICTSLLDTEHVSIETMNYVMAHVSNSSPARSSCVLETINLNFVFSSIQSHEKFEQEFSKLNIPYCGYQLCKVGDLYYLAKDQNQNSTELGSKDASTSDDRNVTIYDISKNYEQASNTTVRSVSTENNEYASTYDRYRDLGSQQSDISSYNESAPDTDVGYDEDVSEGYEDCEWLVTLSNKRQHLPNFWLILKLSYDYVTVYFHCRFMDLPSIHVDNYIQIHRAVCESVKDLCKRVNQLLLLQSLYETKTCDPLLEPDDSNDICNSPISRNASFSRLRSLEAYDDEDTMAYSASLSEASLNFKAGSFSCPVVWETHFVLHPRLKIGPGKSGISRGILALKNILDKFSVSNRNNMFVYRDNQNNVFYLRLHENVHFSNSKPLVMSSTDFESGTVSRSPSIASLPLGQKSLTHSQQSIMSNASGDIRPRVRSFGEKESKDNPNEDTLILKVHGINEAGPDVQHDLVQVLQNRLDDAVLEFLSVMLARNSMCPLTPEDVHFIQKPFRSPEALIRLTVQDFALNWLDAFIHYLKQNLLLFLNTPKYTDSRSHYRFKDYPDNEDGNHISSDDNVFIYNQSQNPSSGSRGICCIALALINNSKNGPTSIDFEKIFETKNYQSTVSSEIIKPEDPCPDSYLEFRIWKQGRVNLENLSTKLKSAVSQATWDIVTEYFLLKPPLCIETDLTIDLKKPPSVKMSDSGLNFSKEVEFNCVIDMTTEKRVNETVSQYAKHNCDQLIQRRKKTRNNVPANRATFVEDMEKDKENMKDRGQSSKASKLNPYETGDAGKLDQIYATYLPLWLEFGNTLNTPSIKKHKITMTSKHTPNIIIGELMNMITETTKAFRCITQSNIKTWDEEIYLPTSVSNIIQKYIIISRNLEQWHSTVTMEDGREYPESINPMNLKHTQKFVPTINNNVLIPRQKILWIAVDTESVTVYSYNWAKDNIERLALSSTNLGYWLCVRTAFLYSTINQKLGLFYNQPLTRKAFLIPNNPYSGIIGNSELMTSFSKDHAHKKIQSTYNLPAILEVFRDNYKIRNFLSKDPVYTFNQEIREIKAQEKKRREEMKILHGMYQSRTSTVTISELHMLIQNARIIHYVHTPLLFLPRWRLKAASTRDHTLFPSNAIQMADKMVSDEKELWHTELCYGFFQEYRNYMQTLGFMPLQINKPGNSPDGFWIGDKSSHNNIFYIQKTILGGILIFTAEFKEPFFSTKLMAIECNRLQNISSRASINRFTLSFLDECDRVKILMHLHSFTYDYHLRCIYNYISGNPGAGVNKLCDRYSVHQFLDDFMKYYNKAPNFARNLVHTDTITINNLVSQGQQLYGYLLSNVDQYNFKSFEMDVYEGESEFILIQVTSTPQVSYKDSQDQKHTDDFDITLVVYNLCTPYSPTDNVLHLRYYLILTSKREIYPKSEVEEKLGKFRTVSSTARSMSVLEKELNEVEGSIEKNDNSNKDSSSNSEKELSMSGKYSQDSTVNEENSLSQQSNSLPYVELYQESVNYLGYYSSHEQLMQQLILDKANTTQKHIRDMVSKGMVHCRTHLLWNRLIAPQDSNGLTYDEFLELKQLAKLEHFYNSHPNLGPLLLQPLSWYQDLAKLLLVKYHDHHRLFYSPDGNIQHYVILHQRYFGAFMLLSLDLHMARGELYAAYREPQRQEDTDLCLAYQKSLIDGFVNAICYFLWSGMISGTVDYRTNLLWSKLVAPQDSNSLTYDEFLELKQLVKLENLYNTHPNLGPLLLQPLSWYQDLAKFLLVKYHDHHRSFYSPDRNIQHYVILHKSYFGAFMLLSLDLPMERGELYAAYREPQTQEDTDLCSVYQKPFIDGFVNAICYFLWSGMISG